VASNFASIQAGPQPGYSPNAQEPREPTEEPPGTPTSCDLMSEFGGGFSFCVINHLIAQI